MNDDLYGLRGKILRIDLSSSKIRTEDVPLEVARRYLGGTALGLYYLLQICKKDVDPLEPENPIIFMTSVTTGAPVSGQGRHTIMSKSPLTGGLADSQCGGWWGAELKFAGYDGIILEGRANSWQYILIEDDSVRFIDAVDLYGKSTGTVDEILHDRHGNNVKILQIGPAGENLVRYAMITDGLRHFAGRGGLGAVMGSKNLRGIVLKGSKRPLPIYNKEKIREFSKWFTKSIPEHPALSLHQKLGTLKGVVPTNEMGLLPTYNFQDGFFEDAEKISGESFYEKIGKKSDTCFGCSVRCKRSVGSSNDSYNLKSRYGGPEYETIVTIGSSLGIDDIYAITKSNEICNAYGLDTISAGGTLAWATECFEKGLISIEDTGGIVLKWNDPKTNHKLLEMIAKREGFGDLLAEGSLRASKKIGRGTEEFSMQVKGQEFPGHEPRGKWGVALGYAISPVGADHLRAAHDVWFDKTGDYTAQYAWVDIEDLSPLGIFKPVAAESLNADKLRLFIELQKVWALHDVLDWCIFTTVPEFRAISLNQLVEIVESISGWRTSLYELLKVGERAITMSRCFNYIHGFTAENDILPKRMFEPIREGALKGHKIDKDKFEKAKKMYYSMMGWDDKGEPLYGKLEYLDLGWISDKR